MYKIMMSTAVCLGLFLMSCQKNVTEVEQPAAYQKAVQPPEEQTVRVIYLVPSDREFSREYYNAVKKAALTLQDWYADNLDGYTFRLNKPIIEVLESDKPAEWFNSYSGTFSGSDPRFYFFYNAYHEIRELLGAEVDGPYVFTIYVDAPGETGAAWPGEAIMPENDLKGLSGNMEEGVDRWIGGWGHELGHAFGLPHPDGDPRYSEALMGTGYTIFPGSVLLPSDKATLLSSGFFFDE